MNYAIIDLEFTSWKGSLMRDWSLPWEKKEIIQIGAIKFKSFKDVYYKKLNIYIKPKINYTLSLYIQKLTGIKQYQLNQMSIPLRSADIKLKKFFNDVDKIFCNGLDKQILIENYKICNLSKPFYLNKIYNIKPFLSELLKTNQNKLVSSELHNFFKFNKINNKKHDGLNDCINIFNCISKIENIEKKLSNLSINKK